MSTSPTPPTIGRIVHFHFHDAVGNLVTRPAMIVRVWNDSEVNLQVFTDGGNDGIDQASGLWKRAQVPYHHEIRAGSWRWPPRA